MICLCYLVPSTNITYGSWINKFYGDLKSSKTQERHVDSISDIKVIYLDMVERKMDDCKAFAFSGTYVIPC